MSRPSKSLQKDFALASKIDLIVVSPMQRTLQTAAHSLSFLTALSVPTIALAELQETSTNMVDVGRPLSELEKEWPEVDWSHNDPVFPSKEGMYAYSAPALVERRQAARKWLRERGEKVIAVVSHAGFLRVGLCERYFGNADWRVFEFGDGEGEEMVEWELTEGNGGGMGRSFKGVAGWEVSDFKYMKGNEGLSEEELVGLCGNTPLR